MRTSHKLTRLFFALSALVVLAASAFAGPAPTNIGVSDQKAGSFLAFPYYTSNSSATTDTRLTISNTGDKTVAVHMFFIGIDCAQADQTICLTANASATFLASEYDPSNSGYLLAVAVAPDNTSFVTSPTPATATTPAIPSAPIPVGCPVQYNGLIGNAFVNDGNYVGNYGAEAFWQHTAPLAADCDLNNWKATLRFNGNCGVGGYDMQPNQFVAEIQSPNDSIGQKIQMVGLRGEVGGGIAGAGQSGIGVAYNDGEKPGSYSGYGGTCYGTFTIDTKTPRVPGGLGTQAGVNNNALIPSGRTGTLKWNTSGSVGLISTSRVAPNKWSGIRTLHKTGVATNNTLVIPIFSSAAC
jgi:hypothetical protein